MPEEGFLGQIKRFVVGEPIPSHLTHHERLSRVTGLAVLSSDPLSSVAYATEEILRVLILLTVAVSIAAGVAALTSAFPQWIDQRVIMALAFVFILTLGNLRGIRESGNIFAAPTYFFIASLLALIAVGAWRAMTGTVQLIEAAEPMASLGQPLTVFLLLRAFSNGCTAMTGWRPSRMAYPHSNRLRRRTPRRP